MRVAGIRYINALPLIYGLQNHPGVELSIDTPSGCYRRLADGSVDVALVPVFATQTDPMLRGIKGLGIASVNRTESVYLFATKPLERVVSVATDPGSMSSAMLVRIILKGKYNNTPAFEPAPISNIHDVLRRHDAALVIGDDAILTEKTDYDHYDLATEWYSMVKLPFVFAIWAATRALSEEEKQILKEAFLEGTRHPEEVLAQAGRRLSVRSEFLKRYYNENLHYQLTMSDYQGLLKFLTLAAEFQQIERIRKDIWM